MIAQGKSRDTCWTGRHEDAFRRHSCKFKERSVSAGRARKQRLVANWAFRRRLLTERKPKGFSFFATRSFKHHLGHQGNSKTSPRKMVNVQALYAVRDGLLLGNCIVFSPRMSSVSTNRSLESSYLFARLDKRAGSYPWSMVKPRKWVASPVIVGKGGTTSRVAMVSAR